MFSLDPRKRYINVNCDIAKNPEFESGVVKILNSEEGSMSVNEQLSCRKLRKSNAVDVEETPNPGDLDDFASVVLAKRLKQSPHIKYENCKFLQPTSNILERFFSSAGYAYDELRQNILLA